jgi:hypothetical protein
MFAGTTKGAQMRLRASVAVLMLLLVGACGGSDEPTAKPTKSPTSSASEPATDAPLVAAPGRVGPVLAGMTVDEAKATGLFEARETPKGDPCDGAYGPIQWKAPNTEDLLVGVDLKGAGKNTIVVLGIRDTVKTAEGVGVGSTLADVKAAYSDVKVEDSVALGSTIFRKDGDAWLGMGFNETPEEIKASSKVVFMEVTKGSKPDVYLDGCGY